MNETTRATNKLTDRGINAHINKLKSVRADQKKLSDGGGLYLTLTTAGTPVWRIKFRLGGKEGVYAVGVYPEISLDDARAEREKVRALLREGRNPTMARQIQKAHAAIAGRDTFEAVALQWLDEQRGNWSAIHYHKSKQALERDVFPAIGRYPVTEVTPAMIRAVVRGVLRRGAKETARKILQHIGAIFWLAGVDHGVKENPAVPVAKSIRAKRGTRHRPAVTDFTGLGNILRSAADPKIRLSDAVRMAHRLCAFTVARISNIVQAEWLEFELDGDTPTWIIPRKKLKAKDRDYDHKIILGRTIAQELRAWRKTTGGKGYLFLSWDGKHHISRESLEKVYRVTLGLEGKHSPHSWRSSFSTLARENGFDRDVVEIALDHVHDNKVVLAYDRGERLEKREKLATWWDKQLTQAQHGGDVIPFRKQA